MCSSDLGAEALRDADLKRLDLVSENAQDIIRHDVRNAEGRVRLHAEAEALLVQRWGVRQCRDDIEGG